jgi:hypothetical protein
MKETLLAYMMAAALLLSIGGSVAANKGGNPNANACVGQSVAKGANFSLDTNFGEIDISVDGASEGITPNDAADLVGSITFIDMEINNAGDYINFLRTVAC